MSATKKVPAKRKASVKRKPTTKRKVTAKSALISKNKTIKSTTKTKTKTPIKKKTTNKRKAPAKKIVIKKQAKATSLSNVFIIIAIGLLFIGFGISIRDWHKNALAEQNAAKLVGQANSSTKSTAPKALSNEEVPATTKPSTNTIASYVVAPNMPRYLIIPKLGVDARILSVGVNSQGALETPDNVFDTAWYDNSALPGQPGAMLIDGHISSWTSEGVFYGLRTLQPGDIVKVQRGDGAVFTYQVVRTQIFSANNVNMSAAITSANPNEPGLNLISCAGDVIQGTNDFNERIIVFTTLV